ncbi:YhjD/YihY/BrkB family envelope integrity protein [Gordonia shandongensis]|uniref:YhjD/YihY/BrkB family envelope integrity protein n=1 Tax=Gordonia shandongensis TaxID=376351 RepID=UPI00042003A0|nr:YhjD/YihY/BrkB family envelope integrity protein [Gordonia shandongensis]
MDRVKALTAQAKALYENLLERWTWLAHVLRMLEWYTERRGNAYAAAISFTGILAMVPILMVSFSVGAFVLAWNPELLDTVTDAVVDAAPGELGKQLNSVIDSAIASRTTVGVIGLVTASLTGIGWMGLLRTALTEMWGGRLKTNAVIKKLYDLAMFVVLGLMFVATIGLTVVSTGPFGKQIMEFLGLEETTVGSLLLRVASILVSVAATWALFIVVLKVLPRNGLSVSAILWPALATAVIFEILKSVGGIYLRSVLSSPAGAAFGPIIGVMVFAYLASRIVLYSAAWCAADTRNEGYIIDDEMESRQPDPTPVVLAPVYEAQPQREARRLVTAAGVGALAAGLAGAAGLRRRRD